MATKHCPEPDPQCIGRARWPPAKTAWLPQFADLRHPVPTSCARGERSDVSISQGSKPRLLALCTTDVEAAFLRGWKCHGKGLGRRAVSAGDPVPRACSGAQAEASSPLGERKPCAGGRCWDGQGPAAGLKDLDVNLTSLVCAGGGSWSQQRPRWAAESSAHTGACPGPRPGTGRRPTQSRTPDTSSGQPRPFPPPPASSSAL